MFDRDPMFMEGPFGPEFEEFGPYGPGPMGFEHPMHGREFGPGDDREFGPGGDREYGPGGRQGYPQNG